MQNFNASTFISNESYREICELKAYSPEAIKASALARRKVAVPARPMVIAAADHNARMINEYEGDPLGLANRREYLSRLIRMCMTSEVDAIEAAPDVMEDLFAASIVCKKRHGYDFLDGKLLIGTLNRGGLKGCAWEMDDMPCCFTVERLEELKLDGVKFMLRINPECPESRNTLRYCAEAVNEASRASLPIFIETLYITGTAERGYKLQTDALSLCRSVGVTSALGRSSAGKWLELPLGREYNKGIESSTCPVLVVPDEIEREGAAVVAEYTRQIGAHEQIHGILLGRNVMFFPGDPLELSHAIGEKWHGNSENIENHCISVI